LNLKAARKPKKAFLNFLLIFKLCEKTLPKILYFYLFFIFLISQETKINPEQQQAVVVKYR
jgi:hypothetical protein